MNLDDTILSELPRYRRSGAAQYSDADMASTVCSDMVTSWRASEVCFDRKAAQGSDPSTAPRGHLKLMSETT